MIKNQKFMSRRYTAKCIQVNNKIVGRLYRIVHRFHNGL